jgi:Na+-transporting NADH:ubiquinone oxidoreductase subunit A
MVPVQTIKKGLDINLKGKAALETTTVGCMDSWSMTPSDYHGLTPKVIVKEGDVVLAGSPLMVDKQQPDIKYVSAVSGTVSAVVRGEKRALLNILVKPDMKTSYMEFPKENPLNLTEEAVKSRICEAGLWPYIKQRPYDISANPEKTPRAIFVSGFDTAPLAPDYTYILKGQGADLQTGLNALTRLTPGLVFLSLPESCDSAELRGVQRVETRLFKGPHPAGLVGVQINHIAPINKGEVVWTINLLDVLFIGRLFNQGKVDLTRQLAVTGPEVIRPTYVRCVPGTPLSAIVGGNVYKEIPLRFINGNALTGSRVETNGYLGAYATQVTVLHEGTDIHELFGWVMPRFNVFSASRTYFTWLTNVLFPNKAYEPDTRMLGGERALIMSGEYDKVFPMDILPEQLVRACLTNDLEKMEQLGIYEVAPEDFALCEYVCTSKIEVQQVIREALDALKKENGD